MLNKVLGIIMILILLNIVYGILFSVVYDTTGLSRTCYDLAVQKSMVIQTQRICGLGCTTVNNIDVDTGLEIHNGSIVAVARCSTNNFEPYSDNTSTFGNYANFTLKTRGRTK